MKKLRIALLSTTIAVVGVLMLTSCQPLDEKETGVLIGIEAPMTPGPVIRHNDVDIECTRRVTLTTNEGEEIRAYCPEDIVDDLREGQTLEVEKTPIGGHDSWLVVRIVAEP